MMTQPYHRILAPIKGDWSWYSPEFVLHWSYAPDRIDLLRAYQLLCEDLRELLDYIEPASANDATYSHRIYELFLRVCTEVETNAKRVLLANEYDLPAHPGMNDYRKLEKAMKLSGYAVRLEFWTPGPSFVFPYAAWASPSGSLSWYNAYNDVKHDRYAKFSSASFENLMLAFSGLFIILFAQFGLLTTTIEQNPGGVEHNTDGSLSFPNSLFGLTLPPESNWSESEMYKFDWRQLRANPSPFAKFTF